MLAGEAWLQSSSVDKPVLNAVLLTAVGAIWLAFAVEFVLLLAASPKRFDFCKKHWLDLVIILLPLVSFLRVLRISRLARVTRAANLGRLSRTYRLKGIQARVFRAVLVLGLVRRANGGLAARRISSLRRELQQKQEEVLDLQQQIAELEKLVHARAADEPRGRAL